MQKRPPRLKKKGKGTAVSVLYKVAYMRSTNIGAMPTFLTQTAPCIPHKGDYCYAWNVAGGLNDKISGRVSEVQTATIINVDGTVEMTVAVLIDVSKSNPALDKVMEARQRTEVG
jgi:hypothetical protein